MKRFATPWMAREALVGFLAGSMAAIFCLFVPLDAVVRVLLALALIAAGYLAGFARAGARLLTASTQYILRLRAELRGCQDHIMETGSARALGAYLETTADSVKKSLGSLATDARSLASDGAAPEGVRATAERMAAQAVSVSETLRGLSGAAPPEPARSPFNVNNLLREALDLCRHRAEEKKIEFVESYAAVPPVFGPASRIHGALLNVLVNAIESMPHGGGRIEIDTRHAADQVVVRVKDGGIGIRPEHLAKVFEPFFTTKPEKAAAGLGLWEAREALHLIGANIEVRSAPHQGTEVVIGFPQAAPMSPGRRPDALPADLGRNTADEGDRRIA
ncbi:MAG TPA: HAMP domain-containing sensor histidine kinase [Patescibacteria group bacterium]|nr:HAMP domain-containing sensor histidine kinase [Patescibacteria group bacterium]